MATISGKWKWNDVISVIPGKTLNINFTSNSKSFIQMIVERDVAGNVLFYVEDVTTTYVDAYNLYDNTWTNEVYKTIDFGSSGQEVSQDIYTWLTQNATQQEEPVVPTTTKSVSNKNLTKFKQNCDNTYAKIGNIPTVSTELVNLGTLSTSGTLTTDQATQIGTTTVGVTARASVNSVTRFYERVNISGTTAMLVSADDDALHVLTVNLSTRAYTLSDVALGGGSGPEIPTPTTSDNGKVLGVANGTYSLLNLFPIGAYYITESTTTPASLFGGEWVQVSGKFLLGQSVQDGYLVGSEGGEKTHTLTTEEMPEHYHQLGSKPNTGNIVAAGPYSADGGGYNNNFESYIDSTWAGGNQPHNNMPPYRIVNIWRRTA